MKQILNTETNPESCLASVKRGILNVSLEEIVKDTRSLTRIANLVLEKKVKKFNSKDLVFNYVVETENKFTSNDIYITITHKKRNYFNFNWKIYIEQDDFFGIRIKHLVNVNYTWVRNSDLIGKFIKSKNWINSDYIYYEIRKIQNQLDSLNSTKRILETFCS